MLRKFFNGGAGSEPVRQYATQAVNFSSQYGTTNTHSYTAANLAGDPKIYDSYGDFQEAFVLVRFPAVSEQARLL